MTTKKTRVIIALAGLLVASMPAFAQGRRYYPEREGAFRIHLGAFQPDGESEYWEEKEEDFTGSVDDFENAVFGLDYLLPLNRRLSLAFSGSLYEGDSTNSYRDFEDNFGDRIRHDTTLSIASGTVGLMLHLTGADAAIQPYLGVGGGAYAWNLTEEGDFIASGPGREIFFAELESDGVAFGYYGLIGLEAPITPRLSIFGEGRWTQVDDELNGDLEGFGDLDLSGREFALGLSWNL
ncbi:MAG TPA: outer membrane beta-barrel protein [Thermoanaerobaculia bacterium]